MLNAIGIMESETINVFPEIWLYNLKFALVIIAISDPIKHNLPVSNLHISYAKQSAFSTPKTQSLPPTSCPVLYIISNEQPIMQFYIYIYPSIFSKQRSRIFDSIIEPIPKYRVESPIVISDASAFI